MYAKRSEQSHRVVAQPALDSFILAVVIVVLWIRSLSDSLFSLPEKWKGWAKRAEGSSISKAY